MRQRSARRRLAWMLSYPVFAEGPQTRKRFKISLPTGRCLAGDDVVDVANWKAFDIDVSLPGVLELFDSVGREDQIEIEGAILELDEVFALFDFGGLLIAQRKI